MADPPDVHKDPALQEQVSRIVEKLRCLSPVRVLEVRDFVDFVSDRDALNDLTRWAASASERSFRQVWDNPDDAEYDRL